MMMDSQSNGNHVEKSRSLKCITVNPDQRYERMHICPSCGYETGFRQRIRNHMATCCSLKFRCPRCTFSTNNLVNFDEHVSEHVYKTNRPELITSNKRCHYTNCNYMTDLRVLLARHLHQKHNYITCRICSKSFDIFKDLVRHINNVHKHYAQDDLIYSEIYKEIESQKKFPIKARFKIKKYSKEIQISKEEKNDIKVQGGIGPMVCIPEDVKSTLVSGINAENDQMKENKSTSETATKPTGDPKNVDIPDCYKNKKFQCPQCPYSWRRRAALIQHMKIHKRQTFQCPFKNCSFETINQKGVIIHCKRVHNKTFHEASNYRCSIGCKFQCETKEEMKIHNNDFHGIPVIDGRSGGGIKSKVFETKLFCVPEDMESKGVHSLDPELRDYKTGVRLVFNVDSHGKKRDCPHCSYIAPHFYMLKHHMRIHTGEKPYACELCPYRGARLSNLHYHLKHHESGTALKCDFCPFVAGSYRSINFHTQEHISIPDPERETFVEIDDEFSDMDYTIENVRGEVEEEYPSTSSLPFGSHMLEYPNNDNDFSSGVVVETGITNLDISPDFDGDAANKPDLSHLTDPIPDRDMLYPIETLYIGEKIKLDGHQPAANFDKKPVYQCPWSRKARLDAHMEIHFSTELQCTFRGCCFQSTDENIMKVHKLTLHGTKKFVCTIDSCDFECLTKLQLKTHAQTHNNTLLWVKSSSEACSRARLSLSSKHQVDSSQKIKKYQSTDDDDDKSTEKDDGKIVKVRPKFQKDKGSKDHECGICRLKMASFDLYSHTKLKHKEYTVYPKLYNKKKHLKCALQCQLCPFRTQLVNNLKYHMYQHTNKDAFKCSFCPYVSGKPRVIRFRMPEHFPTSNPASDVLEQDVPKLNLASDVFEQDENELDDINPNIEAWSKHLNTFDTGNSGTGNVDTGNLSFGSHMLAFPDDDENYPIRFLHAGDASLDVNTSEEPLEISGDIETFEPQSQESLSVDIKSEIDWDEFKLNTSENEHTDSMITNNSFYPMETVYVGDGIKLEPECSDESKTDD